MRGTTEDPEAAQVSRDHKSRHVRRRGASRAPRVPEYLTRREAADTANLSTRTLERIEREGGGPPTIRVGVKVLYPVVDLHAWLRARISAAANAPADAA
jgi:hypothetical protein